MLDKAIKFIKNEIVLCVSLVLAVISVFFVPVNKAYISYIDFRTLSLLLCMMLIMAGLQRLFVFQQLGEALTGKVTGIRSISFILILLCFILSMFITNDVALLTFVPFTVVVLHVAGMDTYLIPVIVLETVAANLGSMLMPMGNPQNLYLYSLSGMSLSRFVLLMLPYSLVSLVLLLILHFILIKNVKVEKPTVHDFKRGKREKVKLVVYLALFLVSLGVVVHLLDYRVGLAIVLVTLLFMDIQTFINVDYSLIFTFVFLFIFIGNLKHIDLVSQGLKQLVKNHEILISIISSQFISNVPSAILLSGFTDNIKGVILGTNLGGLGTLIASMASLISFKIYGLTEGAKKGRYILIFTLINVGMLAPLYAYTFVPFF